MADVRIRRWNDPARSGEGTRVLVCRYRPRDLRKQDETWDEWSERCHRTILRDLIVAGVLA